MVYYFPAADKNGDSKMGYNSTVLVLNDALHDIEKDLEFGKKLVRAISHLQVNPSPQDISAGGYVNAALAIESHNASGIVPILIGGNYAHVIKDIWIGFEAQDYELSLLKELANKLGYKVSKKPV